MTEQHPVDANIRFHTVDGTFLDARLTGITLRGTAEDPVECTITVTVERDLYANVIDPMELFYLWRPVRLGDTPFTEATPVQMTMRFRHDFLMELEDIAGDPDAVAAYLVDATVDEPMHPYLRTSSWLALQVMQTTAVPQAVGSGELRGGYQTLWQAGEPPVGPIFATAVRFFLDDEWSFEQDAAEPVLRVNYEGEYSSWRVDVHARDYSQQCLIYSRFPRKVPVNSLPAVSEYLHRANWAMPVGNFELDYDTGDVRYKSAVDAEEAPFDEMTFRNLFIPNVLMMDAYGDGLAQVLGGTSPQDAIDAVEKAMMEDTEA
jgi:hypothetical protein